MHEADRRELDDILAVMKRYKADYMNQVVRGTNNDYLYNEFCEDIEHYVEPFVMRKVTLGQLEINEAKLFLSKIFDMTIDVYLEGKKEPTFLYWLTRKIGGFWKRIR